MPVVKDGTVSMLVTDPTTGKVQIGTNERPTDVPVPTSSATAKRSPA